MVHGTFGEPCRSLANIALYMQTHKVHGAWCMVHGTFVNIRIDGVAVARAAEGRPSAKKGRKPSCRVHLTLKIHINVFETEKRENRLSVYF